MPVLNACCVPLTGTSLLFLVPLWLALFHESFQETWAPFALAIVAAVASLFSVVTWCDTACPHKRRRDKVVARCSGSIFTVVGLTVIPWDVLQTYGLPLWGLMLLCYLGSDVMSRKGLNSWVACHFAFHVCVATGMCLVSYHA
jgi:hypothetical protein